MRLLSLVLPLILVLRALPAPAACAPVDAATDLCPAAQDPCFIDGKDCPVVEGAVLDFGSRAVVLRQGTRLDVGTGTMTVMAGRLELQAGTGLLGHGGAIFVHTEHDIAVLRSSSTRARIDVADPAAARNIQLISETGTVQIDGFLDARGTNSDGVGGSIDISAANVVGSGDVLFGGGLLGAGGAAGIQSTGGLVLAGTIDGSGGAGGTLDLEANGALTTGGTIDIRANAAGGDGGLLTVITTSGSVTLGGRLFAQGDSGTDTEGGASGGEIDVFAGGALTLSAAMEFSGAAPDGQGGDLFFSSVLDTVQTGLIQAQGRGSQSDGGTVQFESERALTLGTMDLHGSDVLPDTGGGLEADAWCDLTVPLGATITTLGDKGLNALRAGGQLTVAGTLKAGGENLLEYRAQPPFTSGATIVPPPTIAQNPFLTPCGGLPPSGCGNGKLDDGEECDDGNTVSCDGCSSTCTIEGCGNGVVECGEQCDDHNTTSCDGCSSTCQIEGCGNGVVECDEQCDDHNTASCDKCSSTCRTEGCGNGIVECGEECEPPGVGGCSGDCAVFVPPGCGDGTKTDDEQCDDGNVVDGDGCSHQCRIEACGNGTIDPGEECDDFNTTGCDECSPTCHFEVCGNGVLDCGEECDDGAANGAPGGTCLPNVCRPGPICTTASDGDCIPCAATSNCDPRGLCGPSACVAGVCTPTNPPDCDDHDACDGVEACDPATGCKPGTPLACDDGDACTLETCDPASGCVFTTLLPFPLVRCRLAAARDVVAGAAAGDLATPVRAKLLALLGLEAKLATAESNAGKARGRKALRVVAKRLKTATRLVGKQRGKKIAPATADAISSALGILPPLVQGLST